jgi:hypothetical protein
MALDFRALQVQKVNLVHEVQKAQRYGNISKSELLNYVSS